MSSNAEQSDRGQRWSALMRSTQSGDQQALRTLLQEISPILARFLRSRIPDPLEVEDACQEALIAIFESRRTYDATRPIEPWLFAIARHVGANHARRHWSWASWQHLAGETAEETTEDGAATPAKLRQALGQLPAQQREALHMTKIEGLSLEEASQRTGTSVGALKVRVHRAFEFLRKSLLD